MAVYQCGACPRLISVSLVPGGNPVALADPENWAISHQQCHACNALLCDRCAPRGQRTCSVCGASLSATTAAGRQDKSDNAEDEDDAWLGTQFEAEELAGAATARHVMGIALVMDVFCLLLASTATANVILLVAGMVTGWIALLWWWRAGKRDTVTVILAALVQPLAGFNAISMFYLRWRVGLTLAQGGYRVNMLYALAPAAKPAQRQKSKSQHRRPAPGATSSAGPSPSSPRPQHPAPQMQPRSQTTAGEAVPDDDSLNTLAKKVAQAVKGEVRYFSTHDFGRQKDTSARSILVSSEKAKALAQALKAKVPKGFLVFAGSYRFLDNQDDPTHAGKTELVVARGSSQFDALFIARTEPLNHHQDTEAVVQRLKNYDARFGIQILLAATDAVDFKLDTIPAPGDPFYADLDQFCTTPVRLYLPDVAALQAAVIESDGYVALWWD